MYSGTRTTLRSTQHLDVVVPDWDMFQTPATPHHDFLRIPHPRAGAALGKGGGDRSVACMYVCMYVSLTSEPGKHDFNLICQDTTENVRRDKTASRSARMRSGGAYADELYCTVCTVVHRPSRTTILQGKVGACHSRFSSPISNDSRCGSSVQMAFGMEKKKKTHPRLGILNKHGRGMDRPHARRIHLASRELP